mgnify:CR=1 FL=1
MNKPYTQVGNIRTFSTDASLDEMVWHSDKKDRTITVLDGEGWQLQYNGSLPVLLKKDKEYFIEAGLYHRLIIGATDLIIKIEE